MAIDLDGAPDFVEPIVGWRGWLAVPGEGTVRLSSPQFPEAWPQRREMVATCRRGTTPRRWPRRRERSSHCAPDRACDCGLYAAAGSLIPAQFLKGAASADDFCYGYPVGGTAVLWGKVIESRAGWRAAFAYPARIFVPEIPGRARSGSLTPGSVALALADYGVPVEMIDCTPPIPDLAWQLACRCAAPVSAPAAAEAV